MWKSTIMPRMLMSHYKNIVCTQPRRLAAINIAKKVAKDLDCKLGSQVGYSVRFEDMTTKSTKLKYVTDGILLKELCGCKLDNLNEMELQNNNTFNENTKKEKKLAKASKKELELTALHVKNIEQEDTPAKKIKVGKYDLIIIDEAHERSLNIDFLFGYLKELFESNNVSTRLLITSATLNLEKLVSYFNCPVLEIKQKRFEISHFYLKRLALDDYIPVCVQAVADIVKRNQDGNILVFLSGQEEIRRVEAKLQGLLADAKILILKLFSSMPEDEQDLVFKPGKRKIILATNIAETSITIDNIKFVVDSGKVRINRRCLESSIEFLEVNDISKAQAKQRAGRSGRTQPGFVYRIYSHEHYLSMEESQKPEILRSDISHIVLALKNLGIGDIYKFKFVDTPAQASINSAVKFLYYLGALDLSGSITKLGKIISSMPLKPEMGLCLLAAKKIGCLNAVATIAAFLDFQNIFLDLKNDHPQYKEYKKKISALADPKGDFYMFLKIYSSWEDSLFSNKFLKKHFLDAKVLLQVRKIRTQLLSFFPIKKDSTQQIERAFCAGFFMNVAKKHEKSYKTIFGNFECHLSPKDILFQKNPNLFKEILRLGYNLRLKHTSNQ